MGLIKLPARGLELATEIYFMSARLSHPIDKYVGSRVRMRRLMLQMTQQELAHQLGLTFQQVQKYEKGTNRVSASRLQHLSGILEVPVPFFFDGAPTHGTSKPRGGAMAVPEYITDLLANHQGHALVRAYSQVKKDAVRRAIVHLFEAIVKYEGK
ncbi:MAG: helix-turn-helix transcriptional regulator [Xanthobacteraceae bacterium]